MKREKLIFVVGFVACCFIGGRLFAAYKLQNPDYYVIDCGATTTIGTGDYADGLDEGDSIGYRLDCSIGGLGDDNCQPELRSPSGTIVESRFYHVNYSAWLANPTDDLSDAYAYPVPYKPNDGNDEEGITFTGLSMEAEIKIYTITGELVKKIIHESGFVEEWYPVENEKGEKVVSGVYIYYIENDKEHKSGKLMIIR